VDGLGSMRRRVDYSAFFGDFGATGFGLGF
ncbi:uncharacterized protein METZ01_LOCUS177436, partial [marine metagenome]